MFREGFRQCILELGGGSGEWGWGGGQKHMPLLWGPAKPLFLTSGDRTGLFMSVHPSIYARTKRESICSWILPKYKRLSLSLYCLRLRVCGLPSMSFFHSRKWSFIPFSVRGSKCLGLYCRLTVASDRMRFLCNPVKNGESDGPKV